ncbi:MAG: Crp/Fnr family transcriptional regulator [Candidatus Adiutrix sp.]|jgi:CRP-like cAMP-binding protein|nr:Crp/Fnr family transcriptional regulator [Candidatus Adiutrix sp.]
MKNFSALKQSPLFQGVSEEELVLLAKCLGCTLKSYGKGETVYLAGDFVREIGLVVCGRVHLIKDDSWGHSNIIAEIANGEMFAEAVVCGGVGVLPVTVVAAADTEVCFMDFQRVISTCSSACMFHTLLIRNMIGVFARKNMMLAGKMEHITKRTTREKLLSYLSEQSKLRGSDRFEIPFDRQGLADYLSVERSALSAEMSRLKTSGIINYRKSHFELLKEQALGLVKK